MREKSKVYIICAILLLAGFLLAYLNVQGLKFNFHTSTLTIDGNKVTEKLEFKANKNYHTLYRNFVTPVTLSQNETKDSYKEKPLIILESVSCSSGDPYLTYTKVGLPEDVQGLPSNYLTATGINPKRNVCVKLPHRDEKNYCAYTENNEYGCTYENHYGFKEGSEYTVNAEYEVVPSAIFIVGGKPYRKFIAYSSNKHHLLIRGVNFHLSPEIVSKKYYAANEEVILYIPHQGSTTGFKTQVRNNFDFGNTGWVFNILLIILPSLFFYVTWYFLGKENLDIDFLPQTSNYPRERKGWKVAAYFNPVFSTVDNNFFSAIILDLYRRKIIETKMVGKKDVYIRVAKPDDPSLDNVEKEFVVILNMIYSMCNDKYKRGEYFNLKKAAGSWAVRRSLQSHVKKLQKSVKEKGKKYISRQVMPIILIAVCIAYVVNSLHFFGLVYTLSLIVYTTFLYIVAYFSTILIKFKGEYYREYLHWQAFKKYIGKSHSIRTLSHKGVIIWDQLLVYASALGQAKKVIKEMKHMGLINESQYNFYMGSYAMSSSFATSSGASGGGVGGVGGGGVGGGGGGGR